MATPYTESVIELLNGICTERSVKIIALERELARRQSDLQASNRACEFLRAELANEQREKRQLVSMSQLHQTQNAEVIEGMKRVQDRLAKYDNALIVKDDAIAAYKENAEVLQKRCEDAICRVVALMKEAEKRKEEDRMHEVLGMTKDDMLDAAGDVMAMLQRTVDEMAWEIEKTRERREESDARSERLREAHECAIELAGKEIERLNAKIRLMAGEMETMREEVLLKAKISTKVEELGHTIQKMREAFVKIEAEGDAEGEVVESSGSEELEDEDEDELEVFSCSASESEWEQVGEIEGESA
jgi:hypothetical protein